jgi:hypothetical protein
MASSPSQASSTTDTAAATAFVLGSGSNHSAR